MSTFVKKFRKGNYDDDNYYSDYSEEEYNQKKKIRKDKQRKLKYYDEYDSQQRYNTKSSKIKAY